MYKLESLYKQQLEQNLNQDLELDYLKRSFKLRILIYKIIEDLISVNNSSPLSLNIKTKLERVKDKETKSPETLYETKAEQSKVIASLIESIFKNPAEYNLDLSFAPSSLDIEWTKTLLIHDILYYGPVSIIFLMRFFKKEELYTNNPLTIFTQQNLSCNKVSEIRVNSANEIFIESENQIKQWKIHFLSDDHVEIIIKRMITESNFINDSSIGINNASPIADFEHPCGFVRASAVIAPASEKAFFTLRIHPEKAYSLNELMNFGMLNEEIKSLLIALQKAGTTIAIAGTMGSGKTTLLSAMSEHWPNKGRKASIEDTPELKPKTTDLVKMRTIETNSQKNISVTQLAKACKRHSVRYIILSEARDGAAWEILQLSQSILGSIMTFHYTLRSNFQLADQALNTLVTLCKQNEFAPKDNDIRHLVASMVQILILVEQSMIDNVRRIKNIFYVKGFDEAHGGAFKTVEIFSYNDEKECFELCNHCDELEDYMRSKGVRYKF